MSFVASRELNPMFEGNLQHDAQEFLRCLLCYLQDAEKEVQKFYNQLPPRLSSRAVARNPIMQRFLKAAFSIGKSQSEETTESNVGSIANVKVKSGEDSNSEAVKANLFSKSSVSVEEKTEAVKSPSKIQVAPNLGDTASVVDKKSSTNIQSGAVPKTDIGEKTEMKIESTTNNTDLIVKPSVIAQPSRNSGTARRGRRFNPHKATSNLRAEKQEELKQADKSNIGKKGKKDLSPGDKLQTCISELSVTKTYSSKKRLGMTSTVLKNASEELFDEIKGSSKDTKPVMNTSSPRKCHSLPVLSEPYNADMQPVVSLTDLHKRSPEIKAESKDIKISGANFENKLVDINANAKHKNCHDDISENRKDISESIKDTKHESSIEEKETNQLYDKTNVTADNVQESRSFQDIFTHFLQTPIIDSDSDSVDLLTDSDNEEDIVMQKKVAKQLRESPRRSPRKQVEMYQSSPRKSVSLEMHTENLTSPRKTLSFDCINKPSLPRFYTVPQSPSKYSSGLDQVSVDRDVTSEKMNSRSEETSENVNKNDTNADNSELKSDTVVKDVNFFELGDRNLFPVVKLEKCDHVFDGSSKSVSANYASRCLTPVKRSPKKSDFDESSNYLKRRNLLADFEIKDKKVLEQAIEEMYNSPVKSQSKCDLIERLFQGSMVLRTRCLQCESSRERREDFHDVSVPVRLEKSDSDDEEGLYNVFLKFRKFVKSSSKHC